MTPTKEEIEAVLAGCDGVAPGPWHPGHLCDPDHACDCSYIFGAVERMGSVAEINYGKPGDRFAGEYPTKDEARITLAHIARLSPEFVRELAALALEALSSREAGWQPIETFPRDHFPRLVYGPYGQLVAFLDVTWAWWPYPATEALSYIPTHWMPLPTPPDQGSE